VTKAATSCLYTYWPHPLGFRTSDFQIEIFLMTEILETKMTETLETKMTEILETKMTEI
jgi:hypothetical protein